MAVPLQGGAAIIVSDMNENMLAIILIFGGAIYAFEAGIQFWWVYTGGLSVYFPGVSVWYAAWRGLVWPLYIFRKC